MNRRPPADYVVLVVIAIVVSLLLHALAPRTQAPDGASADSPTVYSRVIDSGVIRCGYVTYPPGCIKDPNSGELSGVFVDLLEDAAQNLGLEVEWVEEVGWGSMVEGLRADRYDLIGSPVWANATRARLADFSTPLFYSGIGVYVRANDSRFADGLERINDSSVKIATIDGEMSDIIARSQFPDAERLSLPQNSDNSVMLLNVAEGRADVTFVEPYIAGLFLQNHPEALVNISSDRPIRVFPNTMMFRKGQGEFKSMLDVAILELINTGKIQELFDKYGVSSGSFYPPAYPYRNDLRSQDTTRTTNGGS